MSKFKRALALSLSILALAAFAFGLRTAMDSPLFIVQVVEVNDLDVHEAPVSAQAITALAAVPVGKVSLFKLNLPEIEKRILSNSWIREVRLQKRFPQTLSISVTFREPKALMQLANGSIAYVDVNGDPFGRINLAFQPDLPMLSGFEEKVALSAARSSAPMPRLSDALQLLSVWDQSKVSQAAQISSLAWDKERGFRALISYPVKNLPGPSKTARVMVDFGQEIDTQFSFHLDRLKQVLDYLGTKGIAARQIWADAGKKIVVKTAHGS